jgi:hypothetical protein
VVGGVASKRGEGGGREKSVPGMVNEDSVEADQSGGVTLVGPGKLHITQGQLDEPKEVNRIIKHLSLGDREVCVVPVGGAANEVKIARDNPRDLISRIMSDKGLEENRLVRVLAGGIDVGEAENSAVVVDRKVGGKDVSGGEGTDQGTERAAPGRYQPARSANRIDGFEIANRGGEKGGRLRGRERH